jgi:hypothetical protein
MLRSDNVLTLSVLSLQVLPACSKQYLAGTTCCSDMSDKAGAIVGTRDYGVWREQWGNG